MLEGRVAADVRELIALICQVNPTDRDLERAEVERRYALKNRLQSLLVRRFADELELLPAPGEGVALLRHRPSGLEACHVKLDELEADARAFARRRLDERLADEPDPAPRSAPLPAAPDGPVRADPLRLGLEALAAYDYPLAREQLERALGRSPEAALPLLELLVDQLAADAEALALRPRLGPAADDERARVLLGLAAARQGEAELARELAGGLQHPRAVEVHLALARGALGAGEAERAAQHLDDARATEIPSQELLHLEQELAALRARRREPEERALLALQQAGDTDGAERAAHALLERCPGSEAARQVLARIERARLEQAVAGRLGPAEEALAGRRFTEAATLFREALALGAPRTRIAPRLALADAGARAEADAARIAEVAALLTAGERRAGLLAYLALDPALRPELRRRVEDREPGWLDELAPPRSRAREAVDAVLDLGQAAGLVARGEDEEALRRIAAHERVLARLPLARELRAEIEARRRAGEQERARRRLAEADAAAGAGQRARARELLEGLDRRLLDEEARESAAALEQALRRAAERDELIERLERLRAAGDPLGARAMAEALLARAADDEQAHWRARLAELEREVREAFLVLALEGDGGQRAPHPALDPPIEWGRALITADGEELVLTAAVLDLLFVQVAGLDDGAPRRAAVLRLPRRPGFSVSTLVADALRVAGHDGVLLDLSPRDWTVQRLVELDALLPDVVLEGVDSAGPRHVWVSTLRGRERTYVVDLERRRVERELPAMLMPRALELDGEGLMAVHRDESGAQLYSLRGAPRPGLPADLELSDAASRPDGRPGLVVLHTQSLTADEHEGPLHLSLVDGEGRAGPPRRLEGSDGLYSHALASASSVGCCFVCFHRDPDSAALAGLAPRADGSLEELWSVPVPTTLSLVSDVAGRHAAALLTDEGGLRVRRLGPAAPALPAPEPDEDRRLPDLHWFPCLRRPVGSTLSEDLPASGPALEAATDRLVEQRRGDPAGLLALVGALKSGLARDDASRAALALHPDDPGLRLIRAELVGAAGRWDEAHALLEPMQTRGLDDAGLQHRLHLLGIARYLAGEIQEAAACWEQAVFVRGGQCEITPWLALARPLGQGERGSRARRLVERVQQADRALAAGDPAAAIRLLRRDPDLWTALEAQSLGRLAEAHLRLPARAAGERFDKALALASLVKAAADTTDLRQELALPGAMWDRARIEPLVAQARAWLAGGCADPQPC